MKNKLETLFDFILKVNSKTGPNGITHLESWIISRLQHHISNISKNLEEMRTRTAFEIALFEIWNDFRWYMNRSREPNTKVLKEAAETWLKLLTPFAPHICEELWSRIGKKTLISITEWPQVAEHLKHLQAEEEENLLKEVIDDTQNILRATKISPKKIYYYTASSWKWKVQMNILRKLSQGEVIAKDVMTELTKDESLKDKLEMVAKFASKTIGIMNKIPARNIERMLKTGKLNEEMVIRDAKEFLSDRFQAEIVVFNEEQETINDPKRRARLALPCRPSIYIE
jgi:leucyl-tRNA synthetase